MIAIILTKDITLYPFPTVQNLRMRESYLLKVPRKFGGMTDI